MSEAKPRTDAALDRLRELHRYPAGKFGLDSTVPPALAALAAHQEAAGEPLRAAQTYRDLLAGVMASQPQIDTALEDALRISQLYSESARLERLAGDTAAVHQLDMRRAELWRGWQRKLPGNEFVRRQIASLPDR